MQDELSMISCLFVTANPALSGRLGSVVADCGVLIEQAHSVTEGLRLLAESDPDVVLIDTGLSKNKICGFEYFCQQLRPWVTPLRVSGDGVFYSDAVEAGDECDVAECIPWSRAGKISSMLLHQASIKQSILRALDHDQSTMLLERLGRLFHEAQAAFSQGGLRAFLHELGNGICDLVPSAAVAVYDAIDYPPTLNCTFNEVVGARVVEDFQQELNRLCAGLTDHQFNLDVLDVTVNGNVSDTGPSTCLGEMFSVPVFKGEQLQGMLVCAKPEGVAYSNNQLALLYHTVKHLCKVVPSLSKMRNLAIRDSLTGLYNRSYFLDKLMSTWREAQEDNQPVCLIMMDVDRFKTINDYYGHAFGDVVLQQFAGMIDGSKRQTDILARYGGDELVALLPRANHQQAQACAERFMKAVRNGVFSNESTSVHLTASVGVAVSSELPIMQPTDLIAFADKAMYQAKEQGGDCICFGNDKQPFKADNDEEEVNPAVEVKSVEPIEVGKGSLLVVDDEPTLCELFEEMLKRRGFEVSSVTSAFKALEMLRTSHRHVEVVLTDLSMPDMDGTELVKSLNSLSPPVVPIMVTGFSSADNVIAAMRAGAYDFVRKPVDYDQLEFIVHRAVEHQRLLVEVQNYRSRLEDKLDEKTVSLEEALRDQQKAYLATLEALSVVIAMRESNTAAHNQRVGRYSLFLARKMNLSEERQQILLRAATLHDIGKVGVPDAVLLKPGPLNPDEQVVMQNHSTAGYNLLKTIPFLQEEANLVYCHHEHFDGSGYPRGLSSDDIPLESRIFAVADAFDALRSDRVYRKAASLDMAVKEIFSHGGTQFDPSVVQAFMECYEELDALFTGR